MHDDMINNKIKMHKENKTRKKKRLGMQNGPLI